MVPLLVDRIWDVWGSYFHVPKAIFHLLNRDYSVIVCYVLVCLRMREDIRVCTGMYGDVKECAGMHWYVIKDIRICASSVQDHESSAAILALTHRDPALSEICMLLKPDP